MREREILPISFAPFIWEALTREDGRVVGRERERERERGREGEREREREGGEALRVLESIDVLEATRVREREGERAEEVAAALLHSRYSQAIGALRRGISLSLPLSLLSLLSGPLLSDLVSGRERVDLGRLRRQTVYRGGYGEREREIEWFWHTLEGWSERKRRAFLRFVWGRSRLPEGEDDELGAKMKIVAVSGESQSITDTRLPTASTCFFELVLPRYSTAERLRERLSYAVDHCTAIDSDFLPGTEEEEEE